MSSLPIAVKLELLTHGYIREEIESKNKDIFIPNAIKESVKLFVPNLWIETTLLTDKEKQDLLSMIETHEMTKKFRNCEWKLLFRASRDGHQAKDFHDKCDGKENTVCMVHTEYDHICGGYVQVAWKTEHIGNSVKCKNAYMFVLRPTQQIFEQKKDNDCTVAHYHGECFNFGFSDLYLDK